MATTKRDEAAEQLNQVAAVLAGLPATYNFGGGKTRKIVDLIIDAAKEEIRAELRPLALRDELNIDFWPPSGGDRDDQA